MSAPIRHAELGHALATLRLGIGASELHGSLAGFLCAGGVADGADWVDTLQIEHDDFAAADADLLARLARECGEQLGDPELGFEPMLPDDAAPLAQRAEAMVEWCRGFLGGVGLAGAGRAPIGDDAAEILRDFGGIAGSRFDYADADEDEAALIEVLEFVRVGVLLLHGEFTDAPRRRPRLH